MPCFLAIAQQDQAQAGRRAGGSGDAGDRDSPGAIPFVPQQHPKLPCIQCPYKIPGRWVEVQNSWLCRHERGSHEFPQSSPSPLAIGQGPWERGQALTGPWDRWAGGCSPTTVGAASPALAVPGCCLCLHPATKVPAEAKAQIANSVLAWLLLRVYSAFTQTVLAPGMAGEGAVWGSLRGSCPTRDLPHAACPALSSIKVQPTEPEVFE